ncbi:MAG: hypothetical protein GKR90_17665 [Pseudomonadales bacterium]|nr:hypothetical protein [Pseudomonadales bacterium]
MSIQDLGAIGELLAAIATLATLIYLALQIKQNTTAVQSSVADSMINSAQATMSTITGSAANAHVFNVGATDYDSLTADQQVQYRYIIVSLLNTSDLMYWNFRRGTLDHELWSRQATWITAWLSHPVGLELWDGYKTFLTPAFSEYVNQHLRVKTQEISDAVKKYEQHNRGVTSDA